MSLWWWLVWLFFRIRGRLLRETYWVDALEGNDANSGTRRRPLRTLRELDFRTRSEHYYPGDLRVCLVGNFDEVLRIRVETGRGALVLVEGIAQRSILDALRLRVRGGTEALKRVLSKNVVVRAIEVRCKGASLKFKFITWGNHDS